MSFATTNSLRWRWRANNVLSYLFYGRKISIFNFKNSLRIVLVSAFLFIPISSFAHTEVVSVEPDVSQTLTVLPTEVILSFSEPVIKDGTFASITSESGSVEASIRIEEANLFISIPQDLTGTSFSIAYKTVASDGHP
ncbi:MAG: copper resistance CopC family protein, partial [Candidatus Nanopelagicales bacterium]